MSTANHKSARPVRACATAAFCGLLGMAPCAFSQTGNVPSEGPSLSAPPTGPALTLRMAAKRYEQGVMYERKQDYRAALVAYDESGQSGYGPAQKKLGDFYGTGNEAVVRDYETALKWYEKARDQGVAIPVPARMRIDQSNAFPLR
jgi:TPR repeat protein